MSIKIYNGVRYKFSSLDVLFSKLKLLRQDMLKLAVKQEAELLARMATRQFDLATITGEPPTDSFFNSRSIVDERQRQLKLTGQRDPSVDFSFNLVVIPTDHWVIGTFYTDNTELSELFLSQTWIEDYHYQDQTDPPTTISTFEWENRKAAWNTFAELNQPMMYSGFSYTMTEVGNFWGGVSEIMSYVPAIEERAKGLAADLSLMAHFKEVLGDNKIDGGGAMRMARDFMSRDEGKAKIAEKEQELLTKLKPTITRADLVIPTNENP